MSHDSLRYNEVRQKSAHNAFQQLEGIYDQVAYWRIRSLELDLHRGKLGHGSSKGDWFIYHGAHNPHTTVHRLSDFLRICRGVERAIPGHEVMTVFLDIRQAFHTTHSASQSGDALDRLLLDRLGEERIYRPRDLLARSAGAGTLRKAVRAEGWPELGELRGKLIFVLTGPAELLDSYLAGRPPAKRAAFVSGSVERKADVTDAPGHVVFFNMSDKRVKLARTVRDAGFVGRVYYLNDEHRWKTALEHGCHHLATDDINAREHAWSTTDDRTTGYPFQSLSGSYEPAPEPGHVCGVWATSGDVWGDMDSFFFQYADCGEHPDNRYQLYIGGANSFGDDWLKGGVVARSSLAGDAAYFGVFRIAEHHSLRVQYRVAAGGSTVAKERRLGGGVVDEDTLVFVRLHVSGGGRRARGWGSVDGVDWTEIAAFEFVEPLRYQGLAVSSHREASGAKFLFGVPSERQRPPFKTGRLIGPRGDGYGGGGDWFGSKRWRVDDFGR